MTHPRLGRLVAVIGAQRQGSGYLLRPDLVLTAAHVVGTADQAGEGPGTTVVAPGGGGPVRGRVRWLRYDDACDAALVELERPLINGGDGRLGGDRAEEDPPAWGRWKDLEPRPGAVALGFPRVQRDAEGRLDTEQLVGTLKPGTGLLSGRPVLDSLHGVPSGDTPWAGLSGAPVFLDGALMGVVRSDPTAWGHARVELTPGQVLLADGDFRQAAGDGALALAGSAADAFEARLRAAVAREWSRVTVFGVTRSGAHEDSWPLELAYLGLEVQGGSRVHDGEQEPVSRRVENAFAGQRRLLLRGEAGSGKTTLLQWLATLGARQELPEAFGAFRDCVPVLLRLRALAQGGTPLPGPEEFLRAAGSPLAGAPEAAGWMSRRVAEGRVLLLVDGIDEAPVGERRRVRDWLRGLLAAYPELPCVVTGRPSAVPPGWLRDLEFEELSLLPMSRTDVHAFVERWHRAVRADRDEPRLAEWQRQLTEALERTGDLARLARNPLMCSLICALNLDRRGHLPAGRMELYEAALEMLLVRRDRERGVAADSEGLELALGAQRALLEKLAYWLVRNERAELTEDQAVQLLGRALPQLGLSAEPGLLLRHLLIRSGLLRQPVPGAIDFVHRTFQDYLGAEAMVAEGDLPLLLRNAHRDQWEDVVRLAVGHARRRERTELLGAVLDRADSEPQHAHRLRLLAAICLDLAVELDPGVRARIQRATTELVPPRSVDEAKALAEAGPLVLELLPGPDGLDDETAHHVAICATRIQDPRAIALLARYADHPSLRVRAQLAWSWSRFDTVEYGEQVIARLPDDGELRVIVSSDLELATLAALGGRRIVELIGPYGRGRPLERADGGEPLRGLDALAALPAEGLEQLWLQEMGELDLGLLAGFPNLRRLRLTRCDRTDLQPLRRTTVTSVTLKSTLTAGLKFCTGLREVDLWDTPARQLPESIEELTLDPSGKYPVEDLRPPAGLRRLTLFRGALGRNLGLWPQVEQLQLVAVRLDEDAAELIATAFPNLRTIAHRALDRAELVTDAGYEIVPLG